jgi:hypothetical protein
LIHSRQPPFLRVPAISRLKSGILRAGICDLSIKFPVIPAKQNQSEFIHREMILSVVAAFAGVDQIFRFIATAFTSRHFVVAGCGAPG